jgi:hypothetical protein
MSRTNGRVFCIDKAPSKICPTGAFESIALPRPQSPYPLIYFPTSNAAPVVRYRSRLRASDRNRNVKKGPKQPNKFIINYVF